MRKLLALMAVAITVMLAMSSCKSGCGCHGDPFGENTVRTESVCIG